ncbi:hypothetical protein ACXPWS_16440 [Mycobacterium sp. BMJ-28]
MSESLPYQRLPHSVAPLSAETLSSYLQRLTDQNLLRPLWLSTMAHRRSFTAALVALTGRSERSLVSALPELRGETVLQKWPHLGGQVSANAGIRPACMHCAVSRTDQRRAVVTMFASHEQLICHTHHRWIGSRELRCSAKQQFSLQLCPDILAANFRHRRLIRQYGRGPVRTGFSSAVVCLSTWARWPAVIRAPDIRGRWARLAVTDESKPLQPTEVAAWYPNAVAVTEIIASLRRHTFSADSATAHLLADGVRRLREVIPELHPSGASDPFRQAIFADFAESDAEVESPRSDRSTPRS